MAIRENGKIIYTFEKRYDILANLIDELLNKLYEASEPKPQFNFKTMAHMAREINKEENEKYHYPIDFFYMPQETYKLIVNDFMECHNIKLGWDENMKFLLETLFEKGGIKEVYTPTEFSNGENVRHCEETPTLDKVIPQEYSEKVKEMLEDYKNTYKFDSRDYNTFYFSIMNYAPSTNKETVINAWKEKFHKDITIPNDDAWMDDYSYADMEEEENNQTEE